MRWDPVQREILDALGHRVYALAQPQEQMQDQTQMQAPVQAEAPPRPQQPTPATMAGPPSLLAALARAAGVEAARLPDLPALESLRGDARAKRALWPRLRALRRR